MNKKILVIAAHPDDEMLGCGGTIAKYHRKGYEIKIIFLADGEGARPIKDIENRESMSKKALSVIGVKDIHFLRLPDNQLDSLPLLEIIRNVELIVDDYCPTIIFTHWYHDLNIDHSISCRVALTIFRALPGSSVKKIYSFEVKSSTEWSIDVSFKPDHFVDISDTIDLKNKALSHYKKEINDMPHSRSLEAINALALVRGSEVGVRYAEAFKTIRTLG